ncbi:MAG: plastocyanin/azurin family copper-binding protein [Gemmatimonadales bacterium]
MRAIAVMVGLAAAMAGCGGERQGEAGGMADTTQMAPAPAPAAGGVTHNVDMVLEGATAYKFVPAELSVRVGDKVVFHNVSGGPHNVAFWPDSIPAGARAVLEPQIPNPIGPLSSELMVDPGATLTITFVGAPTGEYRFTCTPHMPMGMNGKITVTQ